MTVHVLDPFGPLRCLRESASEPEAPGNLVLVAFTLAPSFELDERGDGNFGLRAHPAGMRLLLGEESRSRLGVFRGLEAAERENLRAALADEPRGDARGMGSEESLRFASQGLRSPARLAEGIASLRRGKRAGALCFPERRVLEILEERAKVLLALEA